jgi:hypothetical protein
MVAAAIGAFVLAVRAMPDVALGHELEERDAASAPIGAREPRAAAARPSSAASRQQ